MRRSYLGELPVVISSARSEPKARWASYRALASAPIRDSASLVTRGTQGGDDHGGGVTDASPDA